MAGHDRPVIHIDPEVLLESDKQVAEKYLVRLCLDNPRAIDAAVQDMKDTWPQSIARYTSHIER